MAKTTISNHYKIDEGNVIYSRGAKSTEGSLWEKIFKINKARAEEIRTSMNRATLESKYATAGRNLISLGEKEKAKEIRFIGAAMGQENIDDLTDVKTFIDRFNEILIGAGQYKAALDRLKAALKTENQTVKVRAPTVAVWFTSNLNTTLAKKINNFINKNMDDFANGNYAAWTDDNIDHIIDLAINAAIKKTLFYTDKDRSTSGQDPDVYGDKKTWAAVYETWMTLKTNEAFTSMIKSKINFKSLIDIKNNEKIMSNRGINKGTSTALGKMLGSGGNKKNGEIIERGTKSRTIAGFVQEYITNVMALNPEIEVSNKSKKAGTVFKSEKMKTDSVVLYDYNNSIETQPIVDELVKAINAATLNTSSLNETAKVMEDFYNNNLKHLKDSFIVYTSTKSYTLSKSYRKFHGGDGRKIGQIPEIIAASNPEISQKKVDDFIKIAYNTGEGAYLNDERDGIAEELKGLLMNSVANLLFDDWISLGEEKGSSITSIHVLNLDSINLPLSVLLIAAGKALVAAGKDMMNYVKISIKLPDAIDYEGKVPILEGTSKTAAKAIMQKAWSDQAKHAQQQSTFSITFLSNFKTELKKYLKVI